MGQPAVAIERADIGEIERGGQIEAQRLDDLGELRPGQIARRAQEGLVHQQLLRWIGEDHAVAVVGEGRDRLTGDIGGRRRTRRHRDADRRVLLGEHDFGFCHAVERRRDQRVDREPGERVDDRGCIDRGDNRGGDREIGVGGGDDVGQRRGVDHRRQDCAGREVSADQNARLRGGRIDGGGIGAGRGRLHRAGHREAGARPRCDQRQRSVGARRRDDGVQRLAAIGIGDGGGVDHVAQSIGDRGQRVAGRDGVGDRHAVDGELHHVARRR